MGFMLDCRAAGCMDIYIRTNGGSDPTNADVAACQCHRGILSDLAPWHLERFGKKMAPWHQATFCPSGLQGLTPGPDGWRS